MILDKKNLSGQDRAKNLTVIHTNDLQSRLLAFGPNREYTPFTLEDDQTIGGIARVATVIKTLKSKSPETTLVIDGGDVLMGTLFHTISREEALEFRLMHQIGYDAITLGNHEFDFRPEGLAQIIKSAWRNGGLPPLVLANAIFSETDSSDDSLHALFKAGFVKNCRVIEKNGLKIGIFGLLGKNAAEVSPFAAPLRFADPIATAQRMAKILREQKKVDVVICASHGGVWRKSENEKWQGEDVELAAAVPEIDVIVGGHSHTLLPEPIVVNHALVLQASSEGRYVGVLDLKIEDGVVAKTSYQIIPIDDKIAADRETQALVEQSKAIINREILAKYSYSFDQAVAETKFDLTITASDANLGNLVSDGIRWGIDRYEYNPAFPHTKTDLALESNGMIRDDILMGRSGLLQVSDLFRVVPLGIGMAEDSPGYPLVSFHLTAAEIKKALEVITSVYPLKGWDYYLQLSGIKFRYNPKRVIFDRVMEIEIENEKGEFMPLDFSSRNQALYKLGCNFYVASFIKVVGNFTYGILTIVPKDSAGNPIGDLRTALVDADPEQAGIQEVKEWETFVSYVRQFDDTDHDSIPNIPERYRYPQRRILEMQSLAPVLLVKNATYVTWSVVILAVMVLLILLWFVGKLVIKTLIRFERNLFGCNNLLLF
jgi:5'-nucleotidase